MKEKKVLDHLHWILPALPGGRVTTKKRRWVGQRIVGSKSDRIGYIYKNSENFS